MNPARAWSGWLFSSDPVRIRALRRLFISASACGLFAILLGFGAPSSAPHAGDTSWLQIYCAAGQLVFFGMLRSGMSRRWHDPACTFAHVLFGISVLMLACVQAPAARDTASQLFLLIVAFDLQRLSRRQVAIATTAGAGGIGLASLIGGPQAHAGSMPGGELMVLAMTAFYVPVLLGVGSAVRRIEIRQRRQRAELADALAQLTVLAERDALTGASNRRHAETVLAAEVARQARTSSPLCLCMLDIDFFKRINDVHGHAVGDAVLTAVVRVARQDLGDAFPIARWGGEEFLVVMPDTARAQAADRMRRLRAGLASRDWSDCAPGLAVDLSIGVCEHQPPDGLNATLERADAALYLAKQRGRGRVEAHGD